MNEQLKFLDIITVYSAILKTLGYEATMEMTSNDELLNEMQVSVKRRLDKIIAQNEEISGLLG